MITLSVRLGFTFRSFGLILRLGFAFGLRLGHGLRLRFWLWLGIGEGSVRRGL